MVGDLSIWQIIENISYQHD